MTRRRGSNHTGNTAAIKRELVHGPMTINMLVERTGMDYFVVRRALQDATSRNGGIVYIEGKTPRKYALPTDPAVKQARAKPVEPANSRIAGPITIPQYRWNIGRLF